MDEEPQAPPPPDAAGAVPPPDPITEVAGQPPAPVELEAWPPVDVEPPPPPTPPGAPPFGIRLLLKDTFARYGADFVRLFLVAGAIAALNILFAFIELGRTFAGRAPDTLSTLFTFALGIIGSSILMALIGGGRQIPLLRAIAKGFRRSLRALLVLLAIGLTVGFTAVVLSFLASTFFRAADALYFGALVATFVVVAWLAVRLYLALPATVVDGIGAGDALSLSWRITKPTGVWLRIIAATLLLALFIGTASVGDGVIVLLGAPPILNVAVSVLVTAFFTPVVALVVFSAYRRLVPEGGLDYTTDPATPAFVAPVFGQAAKVLLVVTLIGGVIGVFTVPAVIGPILDNRIPTVPGATANPNRVGPGKVVFGTSSTPTTCSVQGQKNTFSTTESFAWLAGFDNVVGPSDTVKLRVSRDGTVLGNVDQPSGPYICLGPLDRETGFPAGVYLFEVLVNGEVRASGTVTIN